MPAPCKYPSRLCSKDRVGHQHGLMRVAMHKHGSRSARLSPAKQSSCGPGSQGTQKPVLKRFGPAKQQGQHVHSLAAHHQVSLVCVRATVYRRGKGPNQVPATRGHRVLGHVRCPEIRQSELVAPCAPRSTRRPQDLHSFGARPT